MLIDGGGALLSISIVTYNTEADVLDSVLASISSSSIAADVYVVDNSPSMDLASVARTQRATYLHTGRNLGYGRAHNIALRQLGSNSRYHLILNPDVSFGATVLEELCTFLDVNPEIGWVMPRILYPDDSEQRLCKRLPTPWDLVIRRFVGNGFGAVKGSKERFECLDLDLTQPCVIPNLSGCFALVRTKLLRILGGFDEQFFLYLEDTDLVRRIGDLALTVYYPYTNVCHLYGRGSYKDQILLRHHVISAFRYFFKWGWFIDKRRKQINASLGLDSHELNMVDSAGVATQRKDRYHDEEAQAIALCTL